MRAKTSVLIVIIIIIITTLSSWHSHCESWTRFIWWMQTEQRVSNNIVNLDWYIRGFLKIKSGKIFISALPVKNLNNVNRHLRWPRPVRQNSRLWGMHGGCSVINVIWFPVKADAYLAWLSSISSVLVFVDSTTQWSCSGCGWQQRHQ